MWNRSIRIDYIAGLMADVAHEYDLSSHESAFDGVKAELSRQFPGASPEELLDILALCLTVYNHARGGERAELVLTAPESFRLHARRTAVVVSEMISNAAKSITMTGYSISDYLADLLDVIIRKSQQGIRVRLYINDVDRQKNVLDRLLAWCGKFLQIYDYQKQENDKMAALHAKLIVVDRLTSLVSSANLSYHGMHGNIEMGVLMTSAEKAVKIEDLLNELVRMKIFVLHRQDS